METRTWYSEIIKPSWAPPSWLFGPVWSVLYVIITISYGRVAYLFLKHRIPFVVLLPFILNLFFNLIYSPIQFGTRNYWLATADIILILGTLVWALVVIYPYEKWVTYANIPYLLWVCFATILQISVTLLNK